MKLVLRFAHYDLHAFMIYYAKGLKKNFAIAFIFQMRQIQELHILFK